ncbi:hypothetical protein D3C87_1799250 [compost metagenome]
MLPSLPLGTKFVVASHPRTRCIAEMKAGITSTYTSAILKPSLFATVVMSAKRRSCSQSAPIVALSAAFNLASGKRFRKSSSGR